MPGRVVIDELIVTVTVPANLPDTEAAAVRRLLTGGRFMIRLRRAIRTVIEVFPDLVRVRVTLSR
ncbi:MAG TPA: hypothetical protein VFG68_18205 [Fimbriiglobus sp.]|nr:hypothetical protein [Fimbriiglobus sp.]